jgi:uncharacterized membrane protein YphA (DoxX/SURF4 family)
MIFLIFPAAAIVGFLIQAAVSRKPRTGERLIDLLLRWSFGVALGAFFVFGFSGHIFQARQVAEQIGFPAGNPFQWELGWASLALGVISLIGIWRRDFWWPSAIAAAIFCWGAAWGHVYQMVVNGNHHPNNSGPILYTDVLVPLAILVLLGIRASLGARSSADEPAPSAVGQPAGQQG